MEESQVKSIVCANGLCLILTYSNGLHGWSGPGDFVQKCVTAIGDAGGGSYDCVWRLGDSLVERFMCDRPKYEQKGVLYFTDGYERRWDVAYELLRPEVALHVDDNTSRLCNLVRPLFSIMM
jgi:hypothetical protein